MTYKVAFSIVLKPRNRKISLNSRANCGLSIYMDVIDNQNKLMAAIYINTENSIHHIPQ
jgi:hypothetical protein